MALSETEAIRLALLAAIEFESPTASWLELELKDTLPAAGIASEDQIDRALVDCALVDLERDGVAFGHRASKDVDEDGRPRPGVERLWTITDAGAAELDGLRSRAEAK